MDFEIKYIGQDPFLNINKNINNQELLFSEEQDELCYDMNFKLPENQGISKDEDNYSKILKIHTTINFN